MPDIVYLTFHDSISPDSANRVVNYCAKSITQHNPKTLYFLFSSGGGSVDSGIMLYNYLRGLPLKIVMHNIGSIDSIANAIFLAGQERYATPTSAFLLHGITWNFQHGAALSYTQMQEQMSRFEAAEQLTAQIIGERTSLTPQEVRALFRQGESKPPAFAKEKGLIHEIKNVEITPGMPILSVIP